MYFLAIDSGTTHSRIWLMHNRQVLKRVRIAVGVRNTAIDRNNQALSQGISQAIREIRASSSSNQDPQLVVAAGMITSNLGLWEVKHAASPVGVEGLSHKMEMHHLPTLEDLPIYLIPGVRSGPKEVSFQSANEVDIIRGEETEVFGYLAEHKEQGPLLYIHLGSHTKFIPVDSINRICGGLSTLGGELHSAIQNETILKDSLPSGFQYDLDETALRSGWTASRELGLNRALYLVRILHLNSNYSKHQLASFVLGTLLGEDFRCLELLLVKTRPRLIVVSGLPHLHTAWSLGLSPLHLPYRLLSEEETEGAFLRGVLEIVSHRLSIA